MNVNGDAIDELFTFVFTFQPVLSQSVSWTEGKARLGKQTIDLDSMRKEVCCCEGIVIVGIGVLV